MKNKILLIIIMILFVPLFVYADNSLVLVCPQVVQPNADFTCTVTAKSTDGITGVDATLELDDGLTLKSAKLASGWSQGDADNGHFTPYDTTKTGDNIAIGSAVITVGDLEEGTTLNVSLTNIEVSVPVEGTTDDNVPLDDYKETLTVKKQVVPASTTTDDKPADTVKDLPKNPNTGIATWITAAVVISIGLGSFYILKIKNKIN